MAERDKSRDHREAALLLVAAVFVFSNAVAFSLVVESAIIWAHFYAPLIWLVVVLAVHLALRTLRPERDPYLLPVFALLTGWGLLLQDRLAPNFLPRQTLWFALSTTAMTIVAVRPRTLQPLMRYRYVLLLGGLVLLGVTLIFGVNPSGSGAALWLPVPFPVFGVAYFQPSELLKLLLVIFLASYFTEQEPLYRYQRQTANANLLSLGSGARAFARRIPFLGPLFIMWGFTMLLLVWQQDLGAAALFFIVFIALLYLATGEASYVLSGLAMLFLAGVIAFYAFDTVVSSRVLSWLDPWPNVSDRAYQIVQALYAQAAGGILGQGIGQGHPDYIPVVHSDFILAAISEEWGFVGSQSVVMGFTIVAARGFRTAILAMRGALPGYFHAYLAAGLAILFSIQAFLIMGGVTRLLPLTGITLPFISYGGSSLLISSLAMGLLLYLSADAQPPLPISPSDPLLAQRIQRLGALIIIAFGLVAFSLSFWGIIRGDVLSAREDNPRHLERERLIHRGRIVDRGEAILAETVEEGETLRRNYPQPEAAPVTGYYSLRYGMSGIEKAFNSHLSGGNADFWQETYRRMLHLPAVGGNVRLTLQSDMQNSAAAELAGYTGGLVLLELTDIAGEPVAEIRAMVSQPGYDPNQIDSQFERLSAIEPGPLFNRATQGLYQPGLILQPLLTAVGIDRGIISLDDRLHEPFSQVAVHGQTKQCARPRDEATQNFTWAEMAVLRCPAPVRDLGEILGADELALIFSRFGLYQAPDIPIPAGGGPSSIYDPGLAAIGQDALTVTPLQAALAVTVLADDGTIYAPRLVTGVSGGADGTSTGSWLLSPPGKSANTAPIITADGASATLETWPAYGNSREFVVSVLAGPDDTRNSWYLGVTPESDPRYVIAIVLENEGNQETIERIGRAILGGIATP